MFPHLANAIVQAVLYASSASLGHARACHAAIIGLWDYV